MSSIPSDKSYSLPMLGKSEENSNPTKEEIFEVLSNRRRRYVLHYLKRLDDTEYTSLPELATRVAAWESGRDIDELDYDDRKSVQTSLHQTHLPKLEECNLIEYDPESNKVIATNDSQIVDLYLETVSRRELPWSYVFLGLSIMAVGLATATIIDAYVFAAVPASILFAVTAITFFVASIAFALHYWDTVKIDPHGPPPDTL